MSMTSQTEQKGSLSTGAQTGSVYMGKQDFLSVVSRLIGMELYKLRRRMMSKVVSIISILAVVLAFLLIGLTAVLTENNTGSHTLSQLLPLSLYLAVQIAFTLGQFLIVILVGTIVGGEYGAGTVRLMFTRGPTRTQFLISKIGAAIICIVIGVLGMTLLGILLGQLLNPIIRASPNFDFFNAVWLAHALFYLLITMLGLFVYAMMALFLATLGRSTVAGIAGALVWNFLVESVLKIVCAAVAANTQGITADFFRAVPDYLISNNIAALQQNQALGLLGDGSSQSLGLNNPATLSDLHALLVLAAYLILFIALACWVNERRDITN